MISCKKTKKIILLLTLISVIYSCNINKVIADTLIKANDKKTSTNDYKGTDTSRAPGTKDSNGEPVVPGGGDTSCGDGIHTYCYISRDSYSWSQVDADMYDMYGTKIENILKNNKKFLAGTYIGLNIYESKGFESWANYKVKAYKITYTCSKKVGCNQYAQCRNPNYDPNVAGSNQWINCIPLNCIDYDYDVKTTYDEGCPDGYTLKDWKVEDATACAGAVAGCSDAATPDSIDIGSSSYKITYPDSNDIDGKEKTPDSRYKKNTGVSVSQSCSGGDIIEGDGVNTIRKSCTYKYNREKTCINVKNGLVRYISKDEECDTDIDEFELTPNEKYWKYFIPLNANSKDGLRISLEPSNNKPQSGELCQNIIDNYDNYKDLIIPLNGEFESNTITSNMRQEEKDEIKRKAKIEVENGCKYRSVIKILIEQLFYNEQENGINFEGFNFYYRPIDINNPFPNGITDTSLWYKWSQEENTKLDLSKSFNEITYEAIITDPNIIRNYNAKLQDNKENPYTNWYTMTVEGKSKFISEMLNEGLIETNNITRERVYPLGCGPWNENQNNEDGSKNVFYQPECGNQ